MTNKFKVGDKVVLSKSHMAKEHFVIKDAMDNRGFEYGVIYTVMDIIDDLDIHLRKIVSDIEFYVYGTVYARFVELAAIKTVGFIIED